MLARSWQHLQPSCKSKAPSVQECLAWGLQPSNSTYLTSLEPKSSAAEFDRGAWSRLPAQASDPRESRCSTTKMFWLGTTSHIPLYGVHLGAVDQFLDEPLWNHKAIATIPE